MARKIVVRIVGDARLFNLQMKLIQLRWKRTMIDWQILAAQVAVWNIKTRKELRLPPKTRMTPEQVALNAQKQRHLFEERTGIPLVSQTEYQERRSNAALLSDVPRMLWEKILRRPPE